MFLPKCVCFEEILSRAIHSAARRKCKPNGGSNSQRSKEGVRNHGRKQRQQIQRIGRRLNEQRRFQERRRFKERQRLNEQRRFLWQKIAQNKTTSNKKAGPGAGFFHRKIFGSACKPVFRVPNLVEKLNVGRELIHGLKSRFHLPTNAAVAVDNSKPHFRSRRYNAFKGFRKRIAHHEIRDITINQDAPLTRFRSEEG